MPTGEVTVGDSVGEAVQVGRKVLVGMGVQEGRKVGLVVAATKPCLTVGVRVGVGVLLGVRVNVAVLVGMVVEVSCAGRKSPMLHPKTASNSNTIAAPPHNFLFGLFANNRIIFLYLQTGVSP